MSANIAEKQSTSNTNTKFYKSQLIELGLKGPDDPNNIFEVRNEEVEPPAPQTVPCKIFDFHPKGMKINYWDIEGALITEYTNQKNPKPVDFHQIRYADPKDGRKYAGPKGFPAYPFFPPEITIKYREKQHLPTLFFTEGAKKAFYATKRGLPTVGLTSPHTLKDRETGRLHHGIEKLIQGCKPMQVVFLMDADCWNISEKGLAVGEDVTKRPAGFYHAARTFRQLLSEVPELEHTPKVYYYAIEAKDLGDPKGLDDAMVAAEQNGCLEDFVEEALSVASRSNKYFYKQDITSQSSLNNLRKDFKLHKVEDFYERHRQTIEKALEDRKEKLFRFDGDTYQYNEEKDKLEIKRPRFMDNIYLIGNDWFELVPKVGSRKSGNGKSEVYTNMDLAVRSKTILKTKYPKFDKYLSGEEDIFNGFCCVPDNINYERRVHGNYNKYSPPPHKPEPGSWETIKGFVQHIFGEEEVSRKDKKYKMWELGLDYFTILTKHPTQALPILILYSPENNTGKSTFAELFFEMFGNNVLDISNNDLRSEFNEQFAGKILAICEETLMDKKEDADKLKAWSTKSKMSINPKGSARYPIDFYCKFQLYSNNKKMVYVTEEDDRYWMLQVPPPKHKDPNLFVKMREEIPAFLDFLINREPTAPYENRMWFHPDLYRTALFEEVAALNTPSDGRHLEEELKAVFEMMNVREKGEDCPKYVPGDMWGRWERKIEELETKGETNPKMIEPAPNEVIYMPLKDINRQFFKDRLPANRLKDILEQMKVEKLGKTKEGKYPVLTTPLMEPDEGVGDWIRWEKYNGRPYIFRRDRFLKD